nr:sialomucin core protein 24-like [Dasypus novemcinctus]
MVENFTNVAKDTKLEIQALWGRGWRKRCSPQLSREHQRRGRGLGALWSLLWAATPRAALCVLATAQNTRASPATIKPALLPPTNKTLTSATTPTPATTPATAPAPGTCESHNCLSCVNASTANTACFWIERKEDKSYCSCNSTVSDCHVMNGTEFCSAPTAIPLPTNSTAKITTLPSCTTASPTVPTSEIRCHTGNYIPDLTK